MTPAALAIELSAAYAQEAVLYSQALRCAEEWTRGEQTAESAMPRIMEVLTAVRRIEDDIAPAKSAWRAAGGRASGKLADSLDRIAALLGRLQAQIDAARRQTEQLQRDLSPVLEHLICQQNMRRAYGKVANVSAGTAVPEGTGDAG